MKQKLLSSTEVEGETSVKVNFVLITKTSGVPIYYQVFDTSEAPNDITLLSGFVSAVTSLSNILHPRTSVIKGKNASSFYDFGFHDQRYYVYQNGDYLISILISHSSLKEANNLDSYNLAQELTRKIWRDFNQLIIKSSEKVSKSMSDEFEQAFKPSMARKLKTRITQTIMQTIGDDVQSRYYLLMEEIVEKYNLNKDVKASETISSLIRVFLSMLGIDEKESRCQHDH